MVINDIDLIKQITIKDFEHFTDHVKLVEDMNDPVLDLNLFALEGEKWKDMRSTLSPAFTSSKMKAMFTLMEGKKLNISRLDYIAIFFNCNIIYYIQFTVIFVLFNLFINN